MKPLNDWYPVYYRRNPAITGMARRDSLRPVYGVTIGRTVRSEIYVIWDSKYPAGYIDSKEVVKVS